MRESRKDVTATSDFDPAKPGPVNLPRPVRPTLPPPDRAPRKGAAGGVLWPAMWGLAAMAALAGTVYVLGLPGVERRLAAARPADPSSILDRRIAGAAGAAEDGVVAELARMADERDRILARLELLEKQVDALTIDIADMATPADPVVTGSIPQSPPDEPAGRSAVASDGPAARTLFGVDLGTAQSVDRVQARWTALVDLFGPVLEGLEPRVELRRAEGGAIELRLIAGPFDDAEAAVKLCASVRTDHTICEPRPFAGEPLARP